MTITAIKAIATISTIKITIFYKCSQKHYNTVENRLSGNRLPEKFRVFKKNKYVIVTSAVL